LRFQLQRFAFAYEETLKHGGTPNMHAVQHLADAVEDYGPAHAWTCFPFERMNGVIKDTEVNSHNIEETLMRMWTDQDHLRILPHLTGDWVKLGANLQALYRRLHAAKEVDPPPVSAMTATETAQREQRLDVGAHFACITLEQVRRGDGENKDASMAPWVGLVPGPARRKRGEEKATASELGPVLSQLYGSAAGGVKVEVHSGARPRLSQRLRWFGDELGSVSSRQHRSSWVMVRSGRHMRPARCERFAEVDFLVKDRAGTEKQYTQLFVKLRYGSSLFPPPPPLTHPARPSVCFLC